MARSTVPDVLKIISTQLQNPQIEAFLNDASLWVDEELETQGVLSDERLEVIERYLTAAFIRMREKGVASETMDDVSEDYQVDPEVTDYLLRAAGMDSTGTVRRHFLAAKPTAPPVNVIARFGPGFTEDPPVED